MASVVAPTAQSNAVWEFPMIFLLLTPCRTQHWVYHVSVTKARVDLLLIQLDGISSPKHVESFGPSDPSTISWGFLFFKYRQYRGEHKGQNMVQLTHWQVWMWQAMTAYHLCERFTEKLKKTPNEVGVEDRRHLQGSFLEGDASWEDGSLECNVKQAALLFRTCQ